ncbi:double-strand break repair protein AddB [Sulfitobacter sp. SK012]|uniref:double-strand break repair protein AddB n=1 Tax=Sulfitobacter sp. SK012 TaxID=1389005 RepID=UPI000E0BB26E|nr:double-strand break repair protein AddB [Sulfitobacter sp. SK012]AXI44604.1 double-strand break repair protein AddB [Sulfitobacter sp. SK012]
MFESNESPRVYGLPPGVDFPKALVSGLLRRTEGTPPEALARVDLIVNTRRMARRLREIFEAGTPRLLPRIGLITDLGSLAPSVIAPAPMPPLRRRLELIGLISALLDRAPELAPRASLYDLTDSLAKLMDEIQGEGVTADDIAALDVTDQSGHWQRAKTFLGIAQDYIDQTTAQPDAEARQRKLVLDIAAHWENTPPQNPVIIAGSTGSRGTTMMLMQAVAKLPQGALVLPGFDDALPAGVWAALDDPLMSEDHPQYRFHSMMKGLGASPNSVMPWDDTRPPAPARNRLVSLSLRPAPVTDAWRVEGPMLENIGEAVKDVTLIQADTPRAEALAIAMRLRMAAEEGQTAALITPDRMLTRRVTAALSRWNILPDDSAGTPLHLSPPGRFLRHVAALLSRRLDAEALLTLLKHPLTHSASDRNLHQLRTQRLELEIRRNGLPYPDRGELITLATRSVPKGEDPEPTVVWAEWVSATLTEICDPNSLSLEHWTTRHLTLANQLASGTLGLEGHELWRKKSGEKAWQVMQGLQAEAAHGGDFSAVDYGDLVGALLSQEEVRDRDAPHPDIMIWGTLEARVQGADLVILGGLNDGTWPEAPTPDPWLNRKMRHDAGLLLPERRVGLSAHDYQQAVCAPEVWMTRAIRSEDSETVPSRWLNRLGNLMNGLKEIGGDAAYAAMIGRGNVWLAQAKALEAVERVDPAHRPSPRPPIAARPCALSVTEIKTLIRDPYAIYAKHSLRLRALRPLIQSPDAPLRGIVVHAVMERFIKSVVADPDNLTKSALLETAKTVLDEIAPWPAARSLWLARIDRIADWFVEEERARQINSQPLAFEDGARGMLFMRDIGFTLRCMADRIDQTSAGEIEIYDYKTGKPPTKTQQKLFDKQLLIEAAMVEEGAFKEIGPAPVARASFIGLGNPPVEESAPLAEEPTQEVLAKLRALIATYFDPNQGYTARRMMERDGFESDYDQLSRYGEWDASDMPRPEDLT